VYLYVASWDVNLLGTRAYAGVVTPTTSNFTFSQAGYYEISAGVCIAQPATDPGGNRTIAIYRGATIEQTTMQSGTFGATSNYHFLHTVPSVLALTAGQTASVQLNNQGNAAVTVNPTAQYPAYFTAKYLGQ
jgi:hypothetical protein